MLFGQEDGPMMGLDIKTIGLAIGVAVLGLVIGWANFGSRPISWMATNFPAEVNGQKMVVMFGFETRRPFHKHARVYWGLKPAPKQAGK